MHISWQEEEGLASLAECTRVRHTRDGQHALVCFSTSLTVKQFTTNYLSAHTAC